VRYHDLDLLRPSFQAQTTTTLFAVGIALAGVYSPFLGPTRHRIETEWKLVCSILQTLSRSSMLMILAALHDPSERENQAVSSTRWILAHSSKRIKSQGSERVSTGDCFERCLNMKKAVPRAAPLTFSKTNVFETSALDAVMMRYKEYAAEVYHMGSWKKAVGCHCGVLPLNSGRGTTRIKIRKGATTSTML
jgi:hypothetical protein